MRRFRTALRFLTIFPVPGSPERSGEAIAASLSLFPLVGILIGALAASVALLAANLLSPALLSVCIALIWVAVSGGFHIDGLADTADGFFSSRPRERILEIMKDGRIGAMGVIAIFFVLALKIAALTGLQQAEFWRAALLAPLAGRCAIVVLAVALPSCSPNGLGNLFCSGRSVGEALSAVGILVAAGWFVAGIAGLVAGTVSILGALLFALYCFQKIGGATGDVFGAGCEIAEATFVLTLAAQSAANMIG